MPHVHSLFHIARSSIALSRYRQSPGEFTYRLEFNRVTASLARWDPFFLLVSMSQRSLYSLLLDFGFSMTKFIHRPLFTSQAMLACQRASRCRSRVCDLCRGLVQLGRMSTRSPHLLSFRSEMLQGSLDAEFRRTWEFFHARSACTLNLLASCSSQSVHWSLSPVC